MKFSDGVRMGSGLLRLETPYMVNGRTQNQSMKVFPEFSLVSLQSSSGRRPVHAFTLVDLLVVFAVLGLLGLLVLPALAGTAERSQRARCQNNLRRIALGVTLYAGNNNGKIFSVRSIPGVNPPRYVQNVIEPPGMALAEQVGLTEETNGVWTCPNRPGFPTFEGSPFYQYNIGYQYFGGITHWLNQSYDGVSRSPTNMNTAQPHWALAADAVARINGVWGGEDRFIAYGNMPQHHAEDASKVPQGGNQAFVDGSVHWIQAEKMYFLSTWSVSSGSRVWYWYQDPKDFPQALKNVLPNLRFR